MDYPLLHSVRSTCLSGDFPLPITVGLCFSMFFLLFKLTVSFLNPSYLGWAVLYVQVSHYILVLRTWNHNQCLSLNPHIENSALLIAVPWQPGRWNLLRVSSLHAKQHLD